jgi:hypothetical protein
MYYLPRVAQQLHCLPNHHPRPCHSKHWTHTLKQGAGYKHTGGQPIVPHESDADDRDPRDTVTRELQVFGRGLHRITFKLRARD